MWPAQSIGLSGLSVSQRLINLVGQNIANANTPGYHRQVATLAMRSVGQEVGLGVEILQVRRIINQVLEGSITRNTSDLHDVSTQLDYLRQIEVSLSPGEGSIHHLLEKLFNQAEQLSGQPDDLTQRRVLLTTATALTDQFNRQTTELTQIKQALENRIEAGVDTMNRLATQIGDLNLQIERNTIAGNNPNDLSDRRDQLITELSELIDVKVVPQEHGVVNVMAGGVPLVLRGQTMKLQYSVDTNDNAVISAAGLPTPLPISGGSLAGALEVRNTILPGVQSRLDTLAHELVRRIDTVHATGLGLSGPFNVLYGQRSVNNINAPLSQAGLAFPPQVGSVYVSVTNLGTGQRVLTQLTIDPDTQSLQDVATAFNGVSNIQAVVNTQNNTLTILAQPGYTFDFAGRLATDPQTVAITGTSTVQVGGNYTGTDNDNYTYTVVGSGTVGVTPNLTLEVRNGVGSLLASLNIGQGYAPSSDLPDVNGVRVRLSSGTLNAGDSFQTRVVGQADAAGLLPALGLNSFFQGNITGGLSVRPDLLTNPERLAASRSGQPGDGANLRRFADLRDGLVLSGGRQTFTQFYATLTGDIGGQVDDLSQRQTAHDILAQRLEAERQAISGVDPNEEMVRLLQFQRSFQFASRYLGVVNETLGELLSIVQ